MTVQLNRSSLIRLLAGALMIGAANAAAAAPPQSGALVSWGYDEYGQVSQTPPGNNFAAVAAGGYHCVALRTDGTLVSWGLDNFGQVSQTPTGNNFAAVSAGGYYSVALRTDGTLVSWGYNYEGQVSQTPTGNNFAAVAAGTYHSVALRTDGTLVSWGSNSDGQVSQTPPGGDFAAVSAGHYHGVAIKSANRPPVAAIIGSAAEDTDEGPAVSTHCADATGATITLDGTGSSDPDGDALTYQWSIIDGPTGAMFADSTAATTTGNFLPGAYTVKLTVADGKGGTNSSTVAVTVNVVPRAMLSASAAGDVDAGPNVLVQGTGPAGTTVALDGSASFDPDAGDTLEYAWSVAQGSGAVLSNLDQPVASGVFPPGVYTVKLTVYDVNDGSRKGGVDVAEVQITVVADTTPPVATVTTDLTALWPANNKMVPVTITVQATDISTAAGQLTVRCKVSSNQPDLTSDDPTLFGDVNGQDGYVAPVEVALTYANGVYSGVVLLRAERQGGVKAGRTYSINVTATDQAGNASNRACTTVLVPHDKSK